MTKPSSTTADVPESMTAHRLMMLDVEHRIRANTPLLVICTLEEKRVTEALSLICDLQPAEPWDLVSWDLVSGLQTESPSFLLPPEKERFLNQRSVLQWYDRQVPRTAKNYLVTLLKGYHKFLGTEPGAAEGQVERETVRHLVNLSQQEGTRKTLILMMPDPTHLPPELEKACVVFDWPLPEPEHIRECVESAIETARQHPQLAKLCDLDYSEEEMDHIVRACQGVTLQEVDLTSTYLLVKERRIDAGRLAQIKKEAVKRSSVLEWWDPASELTEVGGLAELKRYLSRRKEAFSDVAREYGLASSPKGLLIVGVQGGGKSLCARAIAAELGFPLLRLDMGRVFGGLLGSSEQNIRQAIKVAEATEPAVLWVDEVEKSVPSGGGGGSLDGGTSSRVFGTLLTWLQEKKSSVYVVATGNDVSRLPPEFLRKGRFDEIFFVDLPDSAERKDIFTIHLKKRGRRPEEFDLALCASVTEGYTGAEIESCVESALYEGFHDGMRPIRTADLVTAAQETIPLSRLADRQIKALREWAQGRARHASRSTSEMVGEAETSLGEALRHTAREILPPKSSISPDPFGDEL